ncbi:autoinducer-2 kinase [Cereibacter sphaeroides]|uniref:autoinducer-2 kinase n=1 Tax=Cereibacter sphaeroides TaxID=1063 RepID=UPI000191CE25|nr:autoinducer-2 kinase [Cereibacter sphaeroides]ACM03532.1 Carbohydrate kinase, FGGY [Cereibacter sphaeroides KD131]EKX57308.1 Autoinducer 2 (AI-2) kinase LsrK [Rhodobacter sp. AKP1]
MPYFLAIDAGTGSGRAVLFDETGAEIAASGQEWWHVTDPRYPGSMDFDTEGNWAILARCCREVIARSGVDPAEIRAVSATAMREAFVLHDASGREIWACANVDARAGAEVRELKEAHPGLEAEIYARSGQTYALGALPRLAWLRRHAPETLARARSLTMLSDWILYRLSGELTLEPSNGGTTGLLDLRTRAPLTEALATVGLPTDLFPRGVTTGEVVGEVQTAAAAETGLAPGTLVVAGGGDCQTGALGLGIVREGDCAVLGGTFWQQVVNVPLTLTDPTMNLRINPHMVAGLNQAEAISFFVGAVMRWFRDSFGQGRDYTALEADSMQVPPGAHGIIPIFSDVMRYGDWFHAAPSLLNLSLDPATSGPAAIFRALQENAAIVARRNLESVFALTGHRPERLVFAGGAAKSAHWSQILADVTGLTVVTPEVKEATAQGCASAAATGAGHFASLAEAGGAWMRIDRTFTPDPALRPLYDEAGDRWARAYAAQRGLVQDGTATAMWRAPGT